MPVQSAQSGIVICTAAGVGIFCTFLWHIFTKARARAVELEIRPPTSEPLLRPPGHSLAEQLFELIEVRDEKASSAVLFAVIASVLVFPSTWILSQVLGAPELLSHRNITWLALAAVLAFVATGMCGYRAYRLGNDLLALKKEMHARRLGMRGEQAVGEVLHSFEVASSGYVAFHDVPKPSGGNIDHVVVGPGGVFVIETKARSQQKPLPNKKRNRLLFDGKRTVFPAGWCETEPTEQAKRNAAVVSEWLKHCVESSAITPLLVFPGWEVHMIEKCEELKAMSSNQLRHFFRELPTQLDEATCSAVRKLLDGKCRNVLM